MPGIATAPKHDVRDDGVFENSLLSDRDFMDEVTARLQGLAFDDDAPADAKGLAGHKKPIDAMPAIRQKVSESERHMKPATDLMSRSSAAAREALDPRPGTPAAQRRDLAQAPTDKVSNAAPAAVPENLSWAQRIARKVSGAVASVLGGAQAPDHRSAPAVNPPEKKSWFARNLPTVAAALSSRAQAGAAGDAASGAASGHPSRARVVLLNAGRTLMVSRREAAPQSGESRAAVYYFEQAAVRLEVPLSHPSLKAEDLGFLRSLSGAIFKKDKEKFALSSVRAAAESPEERARLARFFPCEPSYDPRASIAVAVKHESFVERDPSGRRVASDDLARQTRSVLEADAPSQTSRRFDLYGPFLAFASRMRMILFNLGVRKPRFPGDELSHAAFEALGLDGKKSYYENMLRELADAMNGAR